MSPRFGRKSKTAETEPDAASTVVDENGEAVEEAAQERLADDALQVGGDNEDATVGEAGGSGIALAHEFDGTDFQLSDEQLAEVIGQTSGDDAAAGLLGTIGDISTGKPGDDLFGSGEESGPPADPRERDLNANPFGSDPKQPGIDATDAVEAGVFDLIDADDSDPLSSFLDGAEAKLGRDSGLTTPADDAEDAPAYGTGMISDGYAKTKGPAARRR